MSANTAVISLLDKVEQEGRDLNPAEVAAVLSTTQGDTRSAVLGVVNAPQTDGATRAAGLRALFTPPVEKRAEGPTEPEKPAVEPDAETRAEAAQEAAEKAEARSALAGAGPLGFVGSEKRTGYRLPSVAEYRALASTSGTAGVLVPKEQSGSWFDMLRPSNKILAAGARVLTMHQRELVVPRISASTTVQMVAEGAPFTAADPSFSAVTLTSKKVGAFTYINNETLEDSDPSVRELCTYDHVKAVGKELERQFLQGDGTGNNLRGIRNFSGIGVTSLGANGATPTLDNLADALGRFEGNDGTLSRAVWVMSPRSWATIRKIKDSQNKYQISPDPTKDGERSLFGIPVITSSVIVTNETVGTSTDCSWIALIDLDQIVIGQRKTVETTYDSSFAFNTDQTVVRTVARFDIQVLDPKGVELLTGVRP